MVHYHIQNIHIREAEHFKAYRDELLNTWNKATKDYIPECLKYSEFKMFWTTGNRSVYEKPYFHRRHLSINAALLSLIYPDEPAYLDKLMDLLYSIMDEYTWRTKRTIIPPRSSPSAARRLA